MAFLGKLFGKEPPSSLKDALAEAVFRDASQLFDRFSKAHRKDQINGFAFVTVEDAVGPYVMGTSLEDSFGPIGAEITDDDPCGGFNSEPGDWYWNGEGADMLCHTVIEAIHADTKTLKTHDQRARLVFQGIIAGLKKFDQSGLFRGKLPREQMLLMMWVHDPSETADIVMKGVREVNPPAVSKWFDSVYPYSDYA